MDRNYRPLLIALVIMGVFAVIGVIVFVFVLRAIVTPKQAGVPVTIVADVTPHVGGVQVHSTVTTVDGELPAQVMLLGPIRNGYVRDPAGTTHVPTQSPVSNLTVNGEPARPGRSVPAGGTNLTVTYVIEPDNTGALVATIATPISGVDTQRLTVTSTGAEACMQPFRDFVVSDPTHMITTSCDSPAVATPEPRDPDSIHPLPVWVRLHY